MSAADRLASLLPDPTLLRVSALLLPTNDMARDSRRALDLILAWSAGRRDFLTAAREYLAADDVERAFDCAKASAAGPNKKKLLSEVLEAARVIHAELGRDIERLQAGRLRLIATGVTWPSSQDLEGLLRDIEARWRGVPVALESNNLAAFIRVNPKDLRALLALAEIAHDEGVSASKHLEAQIVERLRKLKQEADKLAEDLALDGSADPRVASVVDNSPRMMIDAFRRRDMDAAEAVVAALRRAKSGDVSVMLPEQPHPTLGSAATPNVATYSTSPAHISESRGLTIEHLSGMARAGLATPSERNPGLAQPGTSAFVAWEWNRGALEEILRWARVAVFGSMADEAHNALGEYLVASAKLRILDEEAAASRALLIDAFRWACASSHDQARTHRDTAAIGLALATVLQHLPAGERRRASAPSELSKAMRHRFGWYYLPRLEEMGLAGEQAWLATRMGSAGLLYAKEYLIPYLETHRRIAYEFVGALIDDLPEDVEAPERINTGLALLALVVRRLLHDGAVDSDIDLPSVGKSDRRALRDRVLRFQNLVAAFAEEDGLAAVAADALERAAERLARPSSHTAIMSQRLLTKEISAVQGARVIVELSLLKFAASLHNLRGDLALVDASGTAIRMETPAMIGRLEGDVSHEIVASLSDVPSQGEARLRVRWHAVGIDGVARSVSASPEQFTVSFHKPGPTSTLEATPYVTGGAVRAPEMIFGRQQDIDQIWQTLAGEQQDNIVVLLGERRIGKSTLLNAIEQDRRFAKRYIIVKGNLEVARYERDAFVVFRNRLVNWVRAALRERGAEPPVVQDARFSESPGEAFVAFMAGVEHVLAATDRRLLLILDEVDQLLENPEVGPQTVAALRTTILDAKRTSLILSGATEIMNRHTATREDRLFKLASEVKLSPLPADEARELLKKPAEKHYGFAGTAVDWILRETGRQPYLLQQVGHFLFLNRGKRTSPIVTLTDVEAVVTNEILRNKLVFFDFESSVQDEEDNAIVRALAALQVGNRYVPAASLRRELLRRRDTAPSLVEIQERLRQLVNHAPLVVERKLTTHQYRLRVGLYARYRRAHDKV